MRIASCATKRESHRMLRLDRPHVLLRACGREAKSKNFNHSVAGPELRIANENWTGRVELDCDRRCLRCRSSLLRIRSSYAAVREHISSHCSLALQLKNVKGYPVLNVKVVFPYIIQHFLKFLVEFVDLFAR